MKTIRTLVFSIAAALLVVAAGVPSSAQYAPSPGSNLSRVADRFVALNYNYPSTNSYIGTPFGGSAGNSATGTASIQVITAMIELSDGRRIFPFNIFTPIIVGGVGNQELVTPTGVSNCFYNSSTGQGSCTITASFTYTHANGESVVSGTAGLAEALYDAFNAGGGLVAIDSSWAAGINTSCTNCYASAGALIAALVPFQTVGIEDCRVAPCHTWQPAQQVATVLAQPTTLTATTVGFGLNGANTTGGAYTGTSTYHYCVAYVDIMGNEGPCSADFSAATAGSGSTNQIGFAAPAASTGAVGYIPYISLASGSYNLTYQVPVTSSVCTLTLFEKVTPACAVTNATYGQTGSNAIVSALTVNTAPLHLLKTTASTTSAYIGTPSGRTSYAYTPTGVLDGSGLTATQQTFAIAPAAATTVPEVIATIPVPVGSMNYVGRTLCLEGQANIAANGTTATVQNIEFLWDAAGSNTAGAPVIIGQLQITATGAGSLAENYGFHECFQTTTSGSGVTAGDVTGFGGMLIYTEGAGTLHAAGTDVLASAPVGSLNLSGSGGNTQRLHMVWLHTNGTDANGMQVTALRAWWQ